MDKLIIVPSSSNKTGYHFGSNSNYQHLDGGSFNNGSCKQVLSELKYSPDELYSTHDGYMGRCWIATLTDSLTNEEKKYYFRDFIDLNNYMVAQGYQNFEKKIL